MTRTPRIVRIIPSICSTAMGDFVFFATGEKDYLNIPPMRSRVCDFFASTLCERFGVTPPSSLRHGKRDGVPRA